MKASSPPADAPTAIIFKLSCEVPVFFFLMRFGFVFDLTDETFLLLLIDPHLKVALDFLNKKASV